MFSLMKKVKKRVSLLRQLFKRLDAIEATLEEHTALAAENAALWAFLDAEDEDLFQSAYYSGARRDVYSGTAEEIVEQITDEVLRTMKTQGDA